VWCDGADAVNAEAVYAVMSGGTVENRVYAKVFGITIKDEKLGPDIPGCPPETVKTIASAKPGFHVGFTIVVVVSGGNCCHLCISC